LDFIGGSHLLLLSRRKLAAQGIDAELCRRKLVAHPRERILQLGIGALGSLCGEPFVAGDPLEVKVPDRGTGRAGQRNGERQARSE